MLKKKPFADIIITELFLVKADWTRTFMGTIRREVDGDGNPVLLGEVIVQEGKIWSKADNQEELMMNMDALCTLKLDYGLHFTCGISTIFSGFKIYFN
jgi:hypothetical protein